MKRLTLTGLMIGLLVGCGGGGSATSSSSRTLFQVVQEIVQPQLDQHSEKLGVAVGIVQPFKGAITSNIFFFGRLKDQAGHSLALNNETEFEIGSVSKTLTATVLASLLQSRPPLLSTLVNSIFPQTPTFGIEQATIGDLANYTSKLPDTNRGTGSSSCTFGGGSITDCYDLDLMFQNLSDPALSALQFAPGTEYLYSDLGFALLALAEPILAGSTATDPLTLLVEWESMVGSIVLQPLGMNSTHASDPLNDPALLPIGYRHESSGKTDIGLGYNTSWARVHRCRRNRIDAHRYDGLSEV
jgi:CubicO group peptidase (beta-lactamase class C family)